MSFANVITTEISLFRKIFHLTCVLPVFFEHYIYEAQNLHLPNQLNDTRRIYTVI